MKPVAQCRHVKDIALAGTNGTKFPLIRQHLKEQISDTYNGLGAYTCGCGCIDVDVTDRNPRGFKLKKKKKPEIPAMCTKKQKDFMKNCR